MNAEIQELSPVLVELKVEIPWDRVKTSLDQSFDQVSKRARVKGFRPGKVPPHLVRQLYAKQVRGEVAAQLVEQSFFEAVQQHQLAVVAEPHVQTDEVKDGEPLKFTARVEVRPKIEKVNTKDLEAKHHAHPVTDEQVNQEVEELRMKHSEVSVPDPMRPAKGNDELTIDYTVKVDGVDKPEMAATDRVVDLGSGALIPAFEEGLTGASPGDTKTIEVTFEDDHQSEDLRGKKAEFAVTVKSLRERILPELDDEFAKDVGDYATLLELRMKIREGLQKVADQHSDAALRESLIDSLIEKNPIEVPPSLVMQEERRAVYEYAAYMGMTGQLEQLSEALHGTMHARAERKVKAALLLAAVAREQKIEITDADVDARLLKMSEQTGKHIAKIKAEYAGERRAIVENNVLEEKLMDYLKSVAKLREVSAEEAHAHEHDHGDHSHDHG
ncbi:MAG: trigger factor [Polyangiales bacterium]|nr:trigger factor [Myxococcales bacterium]